MPSQTIPATARPVLGESVGASEKADCPSFSIARVLLIATLLAAPLAFGAVQVWAWGSLALLALLLLILWAVGRVQQGVLSVGMPFLYLPAPLFLVLGAIQFYGHQTFDAIATRESLLKLVTNLIFFFLAGQLVANGPARTLRRFGATVTVFALSLSLFAILQFFSSHGLIYWAVKTRGWVFGPYANHNHYAGLMEMLIPVAFMYVISRPGNHPTRALLGFAVLVPLASLLLSGSRGGLIALLAEVLILAAITSTRAPRIGRGRLIAVGALGIALAAALFFWMDPGDISKRLATVANLTRPPEASFRDRRVVALDCLRILRDHPWIGIGLGSFETVYPRYQSIPADIAWDHAHNDYAEALAETGLLGGALILIALIVFFWTAFRNFGERLRHDRGWIQLGATLGCCGLLVHSFVDFNLHIPANAAWFAVCLAVACTVTVPENPDHRRNLKPDGH